VGRSGRRGGRAWWGGRIATALCLAGGLSGALEAKGETSRIVISGGDLAAPRAIVDPVLLGRFYVWAGAGTSHSYAGGPGIESTEGFIIDWAAGIAEERPAGLPRYEVAFHVVAGSTPLVYTVLYEPDASAGRGYVYVPGRADQWFPANARVIWRGHGFEGHWLHATRAWQEAAASIIPSPQPQVPAPNP
jgi:hypothetical protein